MLFKISLFPSRVARVCRFFILSACFALSPMVLAEDYNPLIEPAVTADIVLDAFHRNQSYFAEKILGLAFHNSPYRLENRSTTGRARAQMLKRLLNDGLWKSRPREERLRIIEAALVAGPLTPRLQRELLYSAMESPDSAAIEFLWRMRTTWPEQNWVVVEAELPSIRSPWHRFRRPAFKAADRFLAGADFVTPAELAHLIVDLIRDEKNWTPCEARLTQRP